MDNPGYSIFGGGSIHLDGIRTRDFEDEEEEEEENRRREEEEENRGREEEIQDMLANAFDDLEEEESYRSQPAHYPLISRQVCGNSINEGAEYPERHQGKTHAQDIEVNREMGYRDLQSSITEYGQRGSRDVDFGSDVHEDQVINEHLSRSSSQDSVVPWSDDSHDDNSNRFMPFVGHETADHHFTVQEDFSRSPLQSKHEIDRDIDYNSEMSSYVGKEVYHAGNYKSDIARESNAKELRNHYKEADTSYDQLKLLYEARGRELDKQMTELSKLKFESSRDVRVMQHQINLLKSENEGKVASNNQLQILLSEKEERIKNLLNDIKELQIKLKGTQDENQKIHFELETAESTISSLECQISELRAADSLARSQQLHNNFVQKLKQGNQEEKDLLIVKLQESQKEGEASQQEVKRLRDELKSLRATYDEALVQKTEIVTKLTVTNETVRKQYEELLQDHDSHYILELQLQVNNLESNKKVLENKVCTLEMDLAKAKEDLQGFDTAMKLGIMGEIVSPGEDSMVHLGIKRTLNYDDIQAGSLEKKDSDNKFTAAQERMRIRDELKKSLLINKAKRNEISRLREENHEKHDQIKKAQCDLKNAHIEIKELRGNLMKLQMEHTERQLQEDAKLTDDQTNVIAIKAENIGLRQESTLLYSSVRELNHSFKELSNLIQNWKNNLSDMNSAGDFAGIFERCDNLLKQVESFRKSAADTERFHDLAKQIREENHKLHEVQALWEKRMSDIQIRMKVLEKMIVTVITDQGKTSEYNVTYKTLQKLLEDLNILIKTVQEENSAVYHKHLNLQDQLTSCQLELERLKKNAGDMKEERDALQLDMRSLEKEKDEERDVALESCQNTYLKFHEEAVHELENKMKAEYENISDNLKREIARLAEELRTTKEMYIRICQEKDEIEGELKKHVEEAEAIQKTRSREQGDETFTPNPKSGDGLDSQNMEKADKDCETESSLLKETYKEESKKVLVQRENIQIRYKQLLEEEIKVIRKESQRSIDELQKKCSTLEEFNSILKDKCKRLEDELPEIKENHDLEFTDSRECESWRFIQERQQKRFDEEKQEIKMQYENLILELQNKYTRAERSKLLEDKLKEQEEDLKLLENKVKEQEKHIMTITDELKRFKEMKDHENEQEVQRLTDMIQNLESEVKEKKEENNNTRATFQKYTQELMENQILTDEKLQKAKEEVVKLRETKMKYNTLKQKFKNSQIRSKAQIDHYKEELTRLTTEYSASKETLLKRVELYVEEVKSKCIYCISSIISTLRGLDGLQLMLDGILTELEELSRELNNFTLQLI